MASQIPASSGLQQLALDVWQTLEQFEFELRTELRRLGGLDPRPATFDSATTDLMATAGDCKNAMEALVREYEETLTTNVSAHARAMINRQVGQVRKQLEQFVDLESAA